MTHLAIPESPMLTAYASPTIRQGEGSSSRTQRLYEPTPRFLLDATPESVTALLEQESPKGKGNDTRVSVILQKTLRWAVGTANIELLTWLAGLAGPNGDILDEEVKHMEDEDGWGLLGMAIQASCGRQEMEEGVRVIVGRWGLETGLRGGIDRSGWSPLHLAALVSTPPLISFLLNRGASPHALTQRGLTPLDLVSGIPEKMDIAVFLEHSSASALVPPLHEKETKRQDVLRRRRQKAADQIRRCEEDERQSRIDQEREKWIRSVAGVVDVSPELLFKPDREDHEDNDLSSDGEDDDMSADMLVFQPSQLPAIFDILISNYRPVCQPLAERTLPANSLLLYARFAHHRCDESWLEELTVGAVERIETGVYGNSEDLAYLSFWAYNTTVLLHLLKSEPDLAAACEELGVLLMLVELVNAIHVFVIRIAERRIDSILDSALLDYETLEDFDDVRFEGEWSLFKSFGTKKKRDMPKASQIFNSSPPDPEMSLLGSIKDNMGSPFKNISTKGSVADLKAVTRLDSLADRARPSDITDILSGVLLVLQLYEVNPAVVIQAFSQIMFWVSCELFNRILSRKKYTCRSKAVQIKMNITALEDWFRANGLPVKTATQHLEPVTQLLRWLQCLSQIRDFDTLIGTLQTLKALNPPQMRRAVQNYRYEVNEGKMADECSQYLLQLQRDWEHRRQIPTAETEDASIDSLFDGTTALADFTPPPAPECLGELLDSRFMIPFLLPEDVTYLVATPPADAAFAHVVSTSPYFVDGGKMSRPSSRSSFASTRPMGWALPEPKKLRRLPEDFFTWLHERECERRHRGHRSNHLQPALDPPLGPSQRVPISTPRKPPMGSEDDSTPTATITAASIQQAGFPSPGLKTSGSLDQMRQLSKVPFQQVEPRRHDSFELKARTSHPSTPDHVTPTRVPHSAPPRWESRV